MYLTHCTQSAVNKLLNSFFFVLKGFLHTNLIQILTSQISNGCNDHRRCILVQCTCHIGSWASPSHTFWLFLVYLNFHMTQHSHDLAMSWLSIFKYFRTRPIFNSHKSDLSDLTFTILYVTRQTGIFLWVRKWILWFMKCNKNKPRR